MARRRFTATTEAASFAAGLPESYLMCRDAGHSWRPHFAQWAEEHGCWERSLICSRCATRRVQYLSRTGARLNGGGYEYPEGYQHTGLGRLDGADRDTLRLESLLRVFHAEGNGGQVAS